MPYKRRENKELRKKAKKQSYVRSIGRTVGGEIGLQAMKVTAIGIASAKGRGDTIDTILKIGNVAIGANRIIGAADLGRTFAKRNGLL